MALAFDQTLVLTDDVLGDGKAQAGSVRAAADHRVEERVLQFGGNPRAVVDDLDACHQAMTNMADSELPQCAGAQGETAEAQLVLPGQCLHGVAHDIEHGLDHLFAVHQDFGNAWIVIAHQNDASLAFRLDQAGDMFEHFMNVGHRQRRQLVRAEHAVDQITQAVGLLDDDFGVVLQVFFGQLAGQQLCRTANAAQRILDLVGQAAHQHLGGFLLGQLGLFLGDAQQAVARQHFQQQHGFLPGQYRGHRVVHGQCLAGGGGQGGFALGERMGFFNRLAQGRQGFRRLGEQLADELSVAALAADGQ